VFQLALQGLYPSRQRRDAPGVGGHPLAATQAHQLIAQGLVLLI